MLGGRAPAPGDRHPSWRAGSRFVQGEAERLPFDDGEFDALTFTYLLRYVDDREATMRELARVVKPGGRIGMVEFGVPRVAAAARRLAAAHARRTAAARARRVPAWYEVGRFLGPNIEELYAAGARPARPVAPSRDRGVRATARASARAW